MIVLVILGCSSDSSDTPPPKEITFADVEAAFSELEVSTGNNDYSLEVPGNLRWNFRVIAPDDTDGEKLPLFVHLHGAAGGNPDAHKSTSCYMEPALEDTEAYVISPNGGLEQWFEPVNQSQVLGLVTYALKYWNVDPAKVVVVGYSNGGNGSWFFAETQPQVFSAGIPMASSYSTIGTDNQPRKIETPLYVIHGENDDLFPVEETQFWVEQAVDAGSQIEFVVAPGLVHNEPCEYVSFLKEGIEWLKTTVWQ
ncbi:MAG: hypothetical protein HKN31_04215 [Pricia sp.]|nr:hypothetical protein [Pricia sp.]